MLNCSIAFRPARFEDSDALQRALWPEKTLAAVREHMLRALDFALRDRGAVLVAYNELGPIGYGQLTVWPRVCEISDLIVQPEMRGHGVGTALIGSLLNIGGRYRSVIEIGAALSNPRALALYRRLGFQDTRLITLNVGGGQEPVMYLTMDISKHGA